MAPAKKKACAHQTLYVDASEHGRNAAGFERIPVEKRIGATTRAGRVSGAGDSAAAPVASTFPGPLILPDDDLALCPKYPPQSLRSWANGGYRNKITPERNTLYVADVPTIDDGAAFMRNWADPDVEDLIDPEEFPKLEHPSTEDIMAYLRAFYHPLPVKLLPTPFKFVKWDDDDGQKGKKTAPSMIGLAAGGSEVVGIRARPSPDEIARMQLNLNDLLDALTGALPADAYAAVMLVAQDMYEDEDDDFCCGRAFGGSRISAVSSFRYRPVLDAAFGVEVGHMWPLSHCAGFVREFCRENAGGGETGTKRKRGRGASASAGSSADDSSVLDLKKTPGTAMGAAVAAARRVVVPKTAGDQRGLWFSRVARTAAHELGHCFGMDHCVYYACVMQGTAGLGEDARQPPYLCPVCEAKLVFGLGEMGVVEGGRNGKWEQEGRRREVERERMEVMRGFCEGWMGVGMFAGFKGWLDGRLRELV
ncbi:hypothetical protein CkaCkLH20_06578 [Colletotrichum karsti]|uniref:Archaemetzincin-2 n=1 Tax=Colletotrichum karsti TaxID=1095194 RepID=A0A9P6I397_9PEZI|nr:uncharacterized protein CkaCkLH20_06578 [Colletotrichum karsti]KAF9876132.1 hypothetical protein CkaCkLH20_06578 [Colletotrichum karsti]